MEEKGKKLVKLNDSNNTIILISEDADPEQSKLKYVQDLKNYKYTATKDLTKQPKI